MKTPQRGPKRLAVLVSGGGSNLQAIIDRKEDGTLPVEIVRVISNVPGAFALERAEKHGIPVMVIPHSSFANASDFSQAILQELLLSQADIVCLAGFMKILHAEVPLAFPGRMLNIHPALLPAFGGKGMYGQHVHEAVLNSGAQFSGATVHIVTEEPDEGPIVLQKTVPVLPDDTPESLANRVLEVEHEIYPLAVKWVAQERLVIRGKRVSVKEV